MAIGTPFTPKVALKSFVYWDNGTPVHVKRGAVVTNSKDPRYKGREVLFGEVEETPLQSNSAPIIETATSEPGSQRSAVKLPELPKE